MQEEKNLNRELGERIRDLRLLRNEEVSEMAAVLGIDPFDYVLIEEGSEEPSIEQLRILGAHFEISLDALLGIDGGKVAEDGFNYRQPDADLRQLMMKVYEDKIQILKDQINFLRSQIDKKDP